MRPTAYLFSMKQCLVVPYINAVNHTPGFKIAYAPVVFSSHRLIIGKIILSNEVLSSYILYIAMLNETIKPTPYIFVR